MALTMKRCDCGPDKWTKCKDPWYLKKVMVQGRRWAPNLTRYAEVVLQRNLTTRTEAERVAEDVRRQLRAGTFVNVDDHVQTVIAEAAPVETGLSFSDLADRFAADRIDSDTQKKPNTKVSEKGVLRRLAAFVLDRGAMGDLPAATITLDDLLTFRTGSPMQASTWGKYRTLIGQVFSWAAWRGHIAADPIASAPPDQRRGLRRQKFARRNRRLTTAEEATLLRAARHSPHPRLASICVALIESGLRIGELLALQWRDINLDTRLLFVRAEEIGAGKTGDSRTVEISDPLRDELLTIRRDPAGTELPPLAYVFGNEVGERVASVDKAWRTCVLKAHGITPTWTDRNDFDAASRKALRQLNLHLHDLRHEHATRLSESGHFSLGQIAARLGHTDVATTAIYVSVSQSNNRTAQAAYDADRASRRTQAAATRAAKSRQGGYKVGTGSGLSGSSASSLKLARSGKSRTNR